MKVSAEPGEQSYMSRVTKRLPAGISPGRKFEPEDREHLGHADDSDVPDKSVFEAGHGRLRQPDRSADVCQAQAAVQPGSPRLTDEVREDRATACRSDGGWSLPGGHLRRMQHGPCLGLIRPAAVSPRVGIVGRSKIH